MRIKQFDLFNKSLDLLFQLVLSLGNTFSTNQQFISQPEKRSFDLLPDCLSNKTLLSFHPAISTNKFYLFTCNAIKSAYSGLPWQSSSPPATQRWFAGRTPCCVCPTPDPPLHAILRSSPSQGRRKSGLQAHRSACHPSTPT